MGFLRRSRTDWIAGLATIAIGIFVLVQASGYALGSARDMGPGYFPMLAGAALVLFGLGIIVIEGRMPNDEVPEYVAPRSLLLIMAAIGSFAILVEAFGLAPATFVAVFLSSLADRTSGLRFALTMATVLTVAAVLLFSYAIGLQIAVVRW